MQGRIAELLKELSEWTTSALPQDQNTGTGRQKTDIDRAQFLLKTDYWSTKLLITRPCLCRIERRIRNESDNSADFNTLTAKACVEAAMELTNLLPDKPNLDFLYSKGPWWAIVHLSKSSTPVLCHPELTLIVLVMQAVAVLLLEMAYENRDMSPTEESMTVSLKKLIRWLRAMQYNDPVARRAYDVVFKILRGCAPSLQAQANELLATDDYENMGPPPQFPVYPSGMPGSQFISPVSQNDFYASPIDSSAMYHPPAFQHQQLSNQMTGDEFDVPTFISPFEQMIPMVFNTPWHTDFDQGAPVVNMQDLWTNTATTNTSHPGGAEMNPMQSVPENQDGHIDGLPLHQEQLPYHF